MRVVLVTLVLVSISNYVISEKSKEDISDVKKNYVEMNRIKRQTSSQQQEDLANQFFDRIFGIPINTLNSVNELVKSTIPMFRRARDRIQQQYQGWQQNGNGRPLPNNGNRPRPSGRTEDD